MAKKRVHEIAKQRGIPSKEVIAVLQRAGLDVKTAAQSIDENDIAMAFSNGGKGPKQPIQPKQREPEVRPLGQGPLGQGPPRPRPQEESPQQGQQRAQGGGQGGQPQRSGGGGGGDRPQRPTRGVPPGRDGGAGGRRRRVVIDSQASR